MLLDHALLVGLAILTVFLLWQSSWRSRYIDRQQAELFTLRREIAQARERCALAEARLEALSAIAFDALFIVNAQRRVVLISPAARAICPIDSQTLIGQTLMSVVRHHELDALVETAFQQGEALENQVMLGGRVFRARAARGGHEVALWLQDITELLRLTRARRDMVANLSHDLRTPISSIKLLVESLMLNWGRNPERDRKLISKIASETDSLQHMTQEIIDLSMIESGRVNLRMVSVPLGEILTAALGLMETQIEQKRLQLINAVPPDLAVLADPDQIRRVLANLIHNAVKFTPAEGQIHFEACLDQGMVKVCVRDTGIGIPPHERTRIFERFYQVDSARTAGAGKNGSGTGLGLAIAKHIIEAHGGTIWAEANIPTGACLCFTIPLADTSSAQPEPQRETSARGAD